MRKLSIFLISFLLLFCVSIQVFGIYVADEMYYDFTFTGTSNRVITTLYNADLKYGEFIGDCYYSSGEPFLKVSKSGVSINYSLPREDAYYYNVASELLSVLKPCYKYNKLLFYVKAWQMCNRDYFITNTFPIAVDNVLRAESKVYIIIDNVFDFLDSPIHIRIFWIILALYFLSLMVRGIIKSLVSIFSKSTQQEKAVKGPSKVQSITKWVFRTILILDLVSIFLYIVFIFPI